MTDEDWMMLGLQLIIYLMAFLGYVAWHRLLKQSACKYIGHKVNTTVSGLYCDRCGKDL